MFSKVGWVRVYAHWHYNRHARRADEAARLSTERHYKRWLELTQSDD
jgi:hypothetical protein